MFLKRIDILGFKSFADKTVIEFSPGITAIVGPNGSGKSNIADAIRWVLGEQSARSLRGSKMEDVIFAGSESRRSINFCEVSITLDNSDRHLPVVFDEVKVTRRVYRSGESEYLINQQPCRLKDITELFMDSGLGREAYSIIGQGKIEEMLSTHPEDRRGPFEDAAGIVKFKFRRKETERKLEETAANIVRVDDILSELERQAGPLRHEAERAERYQALAEELSALEVSLLVEDIDRLKTRWQQAAEDVQTLLQQRQLAAQELVSRERALQQAREVFEQKHQAYEALQHTLMTMVEDRERTEGNLALLRERAENARKANAERQIQIEQLDREIHQCGESLETYRTRLAAVQAELTVKEAELEAAAQAADPDERQRLETDIEQVNAELIEWHQRASALRNEVRAAEEAILLDDRRRERLLADVSRWQAEADAAAGQVAQLTERRQQLLEQLSAGEDAAARLEAEIRTLTQAEVQYAAQVSRAQSEEASLRSRLDLLNDLEAGYDGYALGVKTVLQAADRQRLHGVRGALASLIRVPKAYELAIETALGGALQNIVVETEADARAAIDMLKRQKAGRATFMPMDVIRSRRLSGEETRNLARGPGFIGIASELVDTDEEYLAVVEHLLGNVVVAKTLVDANELARRAGYRLRVVTLEGDVVNPGGTMSGGSHARKGPGLLGRARERQETQERLLEAQAAVRRLAAEQSELRQRVLALQEQQRSAWQQVNGLRAQLAELDGAQREWQARLTHAKDRLDALAWELAQANDGKQGASQRLADARAALTAAEASVRATEEKLADLRRQLQVREQALAQVRERLTALRVEAATLQQEARSLEGQITEMEARQRRLLQRQREWRAAIAQADTLIRETERTIGDQELRLADIRAGVAEVEERLTVLRQERQEAEAEVAQAESAVRAQQTAVAAADEQVHRAEVTAERIDLELNHALRRLGEKYRMTYEWAKAHHPAPEDREAAQRRAAALRRQMNDMGDVQLGAIEEWRRLEERITFLRNEREDLERARLQLQEIIAEIDAEMARRFAETFEQIRQEFQVSFRQLFSGGRADLVLTRPDDLLHTGIEVVAQPPGKKLQNLNLLSGGERALTAMALLFAILRVRPVPFCVLDEVEAALDEANVSRFAQQLRAFSGQTQFIVITHRRGTMEEADALYGVTMQEYGISSLVSVRLADEADFETA